MPLELGTTAAIGFDDLPPEQLLPLYRQLGCTSVQIHRNTQREVALDELRRALQIGGLPCDSLHGIFGGGCDPSASDEDCRRAAVATYQSEGRLCCELGGRLVVVHPSALCPEGLSPAQRDERWAQLARSVQELGEFGRQIGVRYAFENLPAGYAVGTSVSELGGFLVKLGVPFTGLCLDTGHAHLTDTPAGNAAAVAAAATQLAYVHFNDNDGLADTHDMPTTGSLDCPAVMRSLSQARYQGIVMLEVFYQPEALRQLIDQGLAARLAALLRLAQKRDDR